MKRKFHTPADLLNPKRKSGYQFVGKNDAGNPRCKKPFQAYGSRNEPGRNRQLSYDVWKGPRRATALEAAQDACDHLNGIPVLLGHRNKSAGHQRPQQPKRRVPSDIQAARGMIRDWEAQQRKNAQGYVYMIIEDNPGGGLGYCKIGFSVNPEKRVTELQTANPRPLKLLYKMKGTEADEKRLHRKYASINVLQEWFNLNSSLGKNLLLEFPLKAAA